MQAEAASDARWFVSKLLHHTGLCCLREESCQGHVSDKISGRSSELWQAARIASPPSELQSGLSRPKSQALRYLFTLIPSNILLVGAASCYVGQVIRRSAEDTSRYRTSEEVKGRAFNFWVVAKAAHVFNTAVTT